MALRNHFRYPISLNFPERKHSERGNPDPGRHLARASNLSAPQAPVPSPPISVADAIADPIAHADADADAVMLAPGFSLAGSNSLAAPTLRG
jgi:hypothetical protein